MTLRGYARFKDENRPAITGFSGAPPHLSVNMCSPSALYPKFWHLVTFPSPHPEKAASPSPRCHPPVIKGRPGGLWDLAKAGRPETARRPRKVSDRIRVSYRRGERGAMGPAVTVGREPCGKDTHSLTHTHWTCGGIEYQRRPSGLAAKACHGLQHPP